jgi:hypothetical protein
MAEIDGWAGDGRLLLETDELIFRGARRLSIARGDIRSTRDEDGWLVVEHPDGVARFDLGRLAPGWVHAISNPRTRLDKLGVSAGTRVALHGAFPDDFLDELRARGALVTGDDDVCDSAFLRVDAPADLEPLARLVPLIRPAGSIWVLHPKGVPELKHEVIAAAARAAGLVDTKSARFSDTHTAVRFSIPKTRRS